MPQKSALGSDAAVSGFPAAVMQGLRAECAAVWFSRGMYERAESSFYVALQESQNGSTSAASSSNAPREKEPSPTKTTRSRTKSRKRSGSSCNQGQAPASSTARPVNGLPLVPMMLQGVWLQKPLYDQAEAAFYQNLYGQNESRSMPSQRPGPRHAAPDKSNGPKEKKASGNNTKKELGRCAKSGNQSNKSTVAKPGKTAALCRNSSVK